MAPQQCTVANYISAMRTVLRQSGTRACYPIGLMVFSMKDTSSSERLYFL